MWLARAPDGSSANPDTPKNGLLVFGDGRIHVGVARRLNIRDAACRRRATLSCGTTEGGTATGPNANGGSASEILSFKQL